MLPSEILDRTVSLLVELCGISSPSGDAEGLGRVAARLAAELSRCGLATEVASERDSDGVAQPLLIARGPKAGKRYLLLVGHMDTVLEAVPPRIEDGRLLATGALDMKGGLAMLVGALDLLAHRGQKPPDDFMLVVVPDEEASGVISERMVRRWGQEARTLLVIEPGEARGDMETLVAGRRGGADWRLDVTGRAAHSGLAYWEGRSALVAAADWAVKAQRLSRPGPEPTVNVARLVGGDADFVNDLPRHFNLLGSQRRRNVIPDRAAAEGEVRFLSTPACERVLASLEALTGQVAKEHNVTMTFMRGAVIPSVDPQGPGRPMAARVVELARARGWRLEVDDDRGGISFPNFVTDPARVPVVDGLGPVGHGMHTREEYLDLRSLERRIVLLADLLATL